MGYMAAAALNPPYIVFSAHGATWYSTIKPALARGAAGGAANPGSTPLA